MKFKEMDTWSKILFIIGIVGIIRNGITLLEGIFSYVYANVLGDLIVTDLIDLSKTGLNAAEAVQLTCIVLIVVAIIGLLVAWLSIRAAKGKGKCTIPMVVMIMNAIIYLSSICSGSFSFNYICTFLLNVAGVYSCYQIKKKRENPESTESL